jgi:hypothetical protein
MSRRACNTCESRESRRSLVTGGTLDTLRSSDSGKTCRPCRYKSLSTRISGGTYAGTLITRGAYGSNCSNGPCVSKRSLGSLRSLGALVSYRTRMTLNSNRSSWARNTLSSLRSDWSCESCKTCESSRACIGRRSDRARWTCGSCDRRRNAGWTRIGCRPWETLRTSKSCGTRSPGDGRCSACESCGTCGSRGSRGPS